MSRVSHDYVTSLPDIYREVLSAFPALEPSRKTGYGLAYQTIYEHLQDSRTLGEIIEACRQMQEGGAVEVKNQLFVHPTPLGEEIIAELTGQRAREPHVPPFPKPAGGH
jgi:hypothetical protein